MMYMRLLLIIGVLLLPNAAPPPPNTLVAIVEPLKLQAEGIAAFEESFFAANGYQMQMLPSHISVPVVDQETAPDNLSAAVTDFPVPGAVLWDGANLPNVTDYSVRVDVYDGPDGKGFVVVYETVLDGVVYQMVENYGPETWRGHGWLEVGQP